MNLYLISQTAHNDYDTFDSAVVIAPDAETARHIDPRDGKPITDWEDVRWHWCDNPEYVTVTYLGPATYFELQARHEFHAPNVPCASFNAG